MTVLTSLSNGGNLKDYRDTFNAMLADIATLKAGGSATPTPTPAPTPTVTISGAISKPEGGSGPTLYTYTVTRSATTGATSIAWTFGAGATNAADYTGGVLPSGGSIALAAGVASGTIVISVNGDSDVEGDETFTVFITAPAGYAAGTAMSATGTIVNDDLSALGANRTTFTIPPTVQFHPHTSRNAMTVRPDGTFKGYIAGTTLTVTEFSSSNARAIHSGMILKTGAAVGTKIVNRDETSGWGSTGAYVVSISQTVGSASSPVTFSVQGDQCTLLPDLMGHGGDLTSLDGYGPVIMTDAYGITFLRFLGGVGGAKCWLRSKTYKYMNGVDSHNWAWAMVGRILDTPESGTTYVGLGAKDAPQVDWQNFQQGQLGATWGMVNNDGGGHYSAGNVSDPKTKRLFIGHQMQVIGAGISSGDGYNTNSTGDRRGVIAINETIGSMRGGSDLRAVGVTGITLNAGGQQQPGEGVGSNAGYFDLYELSGWLVGEMGNWTELPVRLNAAMQQAMANYSIPPIARSLIVGGDSRSAYGSGQAQAGGGVDGTQTSVAQLLGERGRPWSLPADVRVVPYAFGGQGIGVAQGLSETTGTRYGEIGRPIATPYLLGGGNDYFSIFSDANDMGLGAPLFYSGKWPDTNNGGRAAPGSTGQGDDLFNGADYTGTAKATASDGSKAISLTDITGVIAIGSGVTDPTWTANSGDRPDGNGNIGSFSQVTGNHSAENVTFRLRSYAGFLNALLAKGVKVLWGPGTAFGPGAAAPGKDEGNVGRFRWRIMNEGLSVLSAAAGQANAGKVVIFDPASPLLGGKAYLGWPDYQGGGPYMADHIHLTREGRELLVSGGDTMERGYAYNVKKLMGVV